MAYLTQAVDLSPDADRYQMALLRQKTPAERYAIGAGMIRCGKQIALQQERRRRKTQATRYFLRSILPRFHGLENLMPPLADNPDHWIQDPATIAQILHGTLESLGIPYFISGGVATIVHGQPRYTLDLDLVVEIARTNLPSLVTALEAQRFYCPPGAVEKLQAGQGSILNVVQMDLALAADISLAGVTDFDQAKMQRRQLIDFAETQAWFISPEDLILSKLLWKADSEKQQRDVLGVMKVQEDLLDVDYLRSWADRLGLAELLDRLLQSSR
ncbi:hypothetical protein ACN4EG_15210 [Alkalinema pantanalense CENA528]|uniref:hypothetical protein n=1 Tax=Alkalinema pantanalense TaxID=1620705 RepID=UPI003D6F7D04